LAQYTAPDNVTLTIYRLERTGVRTDPPTPCTKDDITIARSYGCTAITDDPDHAYPFDTSEITIGIEDEIYNGVQQGYLQNVVATEYDLGSGSQGNKPLAGVKAQAIAARTYI